MAVELEVRLPDYVSAPADKIASKLDAMHAKLVAYEKAVEKEALAGGAAARKTESELDKTAKLAAKETSKADREAARLAAKQTAQSEREVKQAEKAALRKAEQSAKATERSELKT